MTLSPDRPVSCPACGTALHAGARFCMDCGGAVAPGPAVHGSERPDPLRDQLVQATMGEYRIERELGRGGMAAVFLAEDLMLGRWVAIKVMAPAAETARGMAERFLLEARTSAQLAHPNIVPIHAVRTTGQIRYFVMKYVPGRPLDRVLLSIERERGTPTGLPVPVVQAILVQVAAALDHAHRRGVVHRDIKPANIMLDEDGTVIVADFGIAQPVGGTGLTQAGSAMGTPPYMSPEQCLGRLVTGASDQYALGCVAWELLTGRPPFIHEEAVPILLAHVSDPVPSLRQRRPDCPLSLAAAVERMLAKEPEARWPGMAEMLEAAEAVAAAGDPAVREVLRTLAGVTPATAAPPSSIPISPLAVPRLRHDQPRNTEAVPPGPIAPPVPDPVPVAERAPTPVPPVSGPASAPVPGRVEIRPSGGALAVGQSVRLRAAIMRGDEEIGTVEAPGWISSDPAVLRVGEDGELTALGPGTASVTATCAGASGETTFQATRVDVAAVHLTPPVSEVAVGESVQLNARAVDRLGTALRGRIVTWSSSDPAVASVREDGTVVGASPGQVRISAAVGGGVAWRELRITPAVVSGVRIEPGSLVLRSGEQAELRATVTGGRGGALVGVPVNWQTSDPAVVSVDGSGTLRALRPGAARVAATAGGRRATIAVEVRLPPAGGRPSRIG